MTAPHGLCRLAPVRGGHVDWDAANYLELRPVTPRQASILRHIAAHVARHGHPPTLRNIADAVGLNGVSTVKYHVDNLRSAGHLAPVRRGAQRASLHVTVPGQAVLSPDLTRDLNIDDTTARHRLARTLIDARGVQSARILARRLDVSTSAISHMQRSRNWEVATVQRWARALGLRLTITLAGIDIPDDDSDELAAIYEAFQPQDPAGEDRLHLRVTVNNLVRARRHAGYSQTGFSRRLGLSENAVTWQEDHPDGWQVATLQRYARALGGVARFGVVPVPVAVEAVAG